MSAASGQSSILGLAARIVSAHVANNAVQAADLPELIQTVHRALLTLGAAPVAEDKPEPAVPVRKSVFPDYIVCLEDGKKLKMLKRHLQTSYGLTPDAYRARWGLPSNYPMVAPSYAERRSALAKSIGLGRKPAPRADAAESEEAASAPPRRSRKPGKAAAKA